MAKNISQEKTLRFLIAQPNPTLISQEKNAKKKILQKKIYVKTHEIPTCNFTEEIAKNEEKNYISQEKEREKHFKIKLLFHEKVLQFFCIISDPLLRMSGNPTAPSLRSVPAAEVATMAPPAWTPKASSTPTGTKFARTSMT